MIQLFHYKFIISQLSLTSHPRSTVVLLDTGTPGTSREIFSEDADDRGVASSSPIIGILSEDSIVVAFIFQLRQ